MRKVLKNSLRPLPALILGLSLAACAGAAGQPTATPPLQDESAFNPVITATGVVVPERWATLSVGGTGRVAEVRVQMGDEVAQGDVLLSLEGREALEAAVKAARFELVSAQQAVTELREGADLARALAEQELAAARDALHDAEYMYRVRQEGNRASDETIDAAEARLVLAEDAVDRAKARYDSLSGRSSDDPARAQALRDLANARQERDAAKRSLNWYTGSPSEIEQAQLTADVAVAQARVQDAERKLARMQAGPEARALEAAEARLANAQAQLAAAEAGLAEAVLRAPFDGTVAEVRVRAQEWIVAGTPVIVLGDLSEMRVETTDLNEIDAARVRIGDPVQVTFDAAPDENAHGEVVNLAPWAAPGGGVNYTAVIKIEAIPDAIRWGMTAFVDIEVQP